MNTRIAACASATGEVTRPQSYELVTQLGTELALSAKLSHGPLRKLPETALSAPGITI